MNSYNLSQATSQRTSAQSQSNLFARALNEVEQKSQQNSQIANRNPLLTDLQKDNADSTLVQTDLPIKKDNPTSIFHNPQENERLEAIRVEQLQKKQMRERLHRMVNPVDQSEIFDAKEEATKKRINEIRIELKKLATEISAFYQEVDITLTQDVASTGLSGTYHENFFVKLKEFIIMLRQRISSARTWARQAKSKQRKRALKFGLDYTNFEAKSVHDSFHHERNAAIGA